MNASKPPSDELTELLQKAGTQTLIAMILALTKDDQSLERDCVKFLREYFAANPKDPFQEADAHAWSLWHSVEMDLDDLNTYGGGDEDTVDEVWGQLEDLAEAMSNGKASPECRAEIQSLAMDYLRSDNAGMSDVLYPLVQACCYSEDEWRQMARTFESMGSGYTTEMAIDIYRQIGDDEKYLAMRKQRLDSASDFLDLAGYHVDRGEIAKAVSIVEQALAIGRVKQKPDSRWYLRDLIAFLSDHALRTGNRARHIELEFEQAISRLTLESYKAFEELCSNDEWQQYESQLLAHIPKAWPHEQVDIYLYRGEHADALNALISNPGPMTDGLNGSQSAQARKLETHFPEEIVKFYLVALGKLGRDKRSVYEQKAKQLRHIRSVLIDILQDKARWDAIADEVQIASQNLPAFRDELNKNVPGWIDTRVK